MPEGKETKIMKTIRRNYLQDGEVNQANFICEGEWGDKHLAYSRLDDNNEIIEEDRCMYAQVRENGHLLMIRI